MLDFVELIIKYEIIILLECWINQDDCFDLHGYNNYSFHRTNGKGGGIVIFI